MILLKERTGIRNKGYPSMILLDGAVGYWRLREVRGTVAKNDCLANDGTYTPNSGGAWTGGTVGANASPLNRDNGLCPTFNGTSGYVDCGSPAVLRPTGGVTAEAWVMRTGALANYNGVIVSEQNATDQGGYILVGDSANKLRFYIYNGSYANSITDAALTLNTWTHVAGTWDGATVRMYVNGVAQTTTAAKASITYPSPTQTFKLGLYGSVGNAKYWPGRIQEAAVYTTAISANQILSHYLAGIDGTRR